MKFDDVSGLSASSPVYVHGIKVGVVERIDYDYNNPSQIVAVIGLDKKLSLPKGTQAEISSDLLGNVKMELKLGENIGDKMAVGDTIMGGMQQGLMNKAAEMVPQVQQMLPKLDSILVNVNTLITDPAVAGSLHNVETLTAQLSSVSKNLHQLTASLNQRMPTMMEKADKTLENVEGLTGQLNEIDMAQTMQRVNTILENVQQLTATLNSSEGTAGLLMRDKELYNHLNATMRDLDALLIDFKEHPKRYINVSVFGRKGE